MKIVNGLIVNNDGDGGDTAQREGFFGITQPLVDATKLPYSLTIKKLEPNQDGIWVRNPNGYNQPEDFSRDQQTPNIWALAVNKLVKPLIRLFKAHFKRKGKFQNKDWASPEYVALYIRAFAKANFMFKLAFIMMYPLTVILLMLGDLFTLGGTLIIIYWKAKEPGKIRKFLGKHVHYLFLQGEPNNHEGVPQDVYGPTNVGTDLNHLVIIRSSETLPTLISVLNKFIYFNFRPAYRWSNEYGKETFVEDKDYSGAQFALDYYFKNEENGYPNLPRAWRSWINNNHAKYRINIDK